MSEAKSAPSKSNDTDAYREKIREAYDGEIFGAAFFSALASRFAANEDVRKKCEIMRDIELATAEKLKPVVARLNLPPSDHPTLEAGGRNAAAQVTEWEPFVARFKKLAPGFVAQFEAIVPLAPPQDQAAVKFLVDHEVAFVDFTEKESSGKGDSMAELRRLLTVA
jgi:hypothetical protein